MKYIYQVEKENYEDAGKASTDIKRTLKTIGIDRRVLKAVAIANKYCDSFQRWNSNF